MIRNTFTLFILGFIFITMNLHGQSSDRQGKLDQLYKFYNYTYKDSFSIGVGYAENALQIADKINDYFHRINAHIYLGRSFMSSGKVDSADYHFKRALELSRKYGEIPLIAKSLIFNAILNYSRRKYDLAGQYLENASSLIPVLDDIEMVFLWNYYSANLKKQLGQREEAINYCYEILKIPGVDKKMLVLTYINMGIIFKDVGNIEESIKYYSKAEELSEQMNMWKTRANILMNMGGMYGEFKNYGNGLERVKKALEIYKSKNDTIGMAACYNSMGMIFHRQNLIRDAVNSYKIAEKYFIRLNDFHNLAFVDNNLAEIFFSKGIADSAKIYNDISLECSKKSNNLIALGFAYNLRGKIARSEKKYTGAIQYFTKSLEEKYTGLVEENYMQLSEIYGEMNNPQKALYYMKLRNSVRDSIFNARTQQLVIDSEVKYRVAQKEKELASFRREQNRLNEKFNKSKNITWLILLFAVAAVGGVSFYYWNKLSNILRKIKILPGGSGDKRRIKSIVKVIEDTEPNNGSKKNIDEKLTGELLTQLERLIIEKKVYLNPEINQSEIAKILNTNTAYLSRLINDNYQMNFSNFINKYRIEEARQMIINKEQSFLTFEGISSNVGFKSKSAFNAAFKKFTGQTPSQFAESVNPN